MLARMPPDGDAGAEEIIQLARDGVTDELLGCLVTRDFAALSRYSARQAARTEQDPTSQHQIAAAIALHPRLQRAVSPSLSSVWCNAPADDQLHS